MWKNGKAHKRTLANLTKIPPEIVEAIRTGLQGKRLTRPIDQAVDMVTSRLHGQVAAALGTLRQLKLDELMASTRSRTRDWVWAMIVARILDPRAKLSTAPGLSAPNAIDTLGESLGLDEVDENELDEAMDWRLARQAQIEKQLAKRPLEEGSLVRWDLTSVGREGQTCELAQFGYSRDGKKGNRQIEFGLLGTRDGRPVAVEVFDGNPSDPGTVSSVVAQVKDRFGLKRVVIVGDRGLLTEARIREDIESVGLDWLSALRAKAIQELVVRKVFQPSLFDERDLAETTCPEFYPDERLIICRNPFVAQERRPKRSEWLAATEREIHQIEAATQREKYRLKGSSKIANRLDRMLSKFQMRKHFQIQIDENGFVWQRNQEKIAAEEALDGFYVVRTSPDQ